ncbi:MAG: PAS domain S-box protein [Chloroflexota bacterium]|nr:PAS domain S-box protein [Chloroflexota bacterium]
MGAELSADLQSRDALLTSLYGQLPVGVAIFDLELRLLHANASWESFVEHAVGVQADSLQTGTCLIDLLPDASDLLPALERVRGGDVLQKSEQAFAGPSGETFWDISLAPVLDNGGVTGIISVITDATARVVAQRAATAKARLAAFRADVSQALASSDDVDTVLRSCAEAMVRHAPAAFGRIWVLDEAEDIYRLRASSGSYTRLNGEYARIPAAKIREKTIAAYKPGLAVDLLHTHQVEHPDWADEHGLVAWATHPLLVRGQVIGLMVMFGQQNFDDDTLGELASVADAIAQFLERKHAEAALREREEAFRRIFESAADGLIITDLETGRILEANPAICAMHGYTRDEVLRLKRGAIIHQDDAQVWREYVGTIRSGRPARAQALALRKDGSAFHAAAQGSPIHYQGRHAALGVIRDITQEQEQQQLLEQRVEERTRELRTLLDISRTVTLTPELEPLVELIFDQMQRLMDYESVAIALVDGDLLTTVAVRRDETGARFPTSLGNQFSIEWPQPLWQALVAGETMYTPNVYGDDDTARTFRERVGDQLHTTYAHVVSFLAAPLVVKNEFIGAMFISSATEDRYRQHDIDLVTATANQIAVAIQNTRLHAQTRAMAALEERQRLARELHDSVSQALYGIGLGARTARAQLDRDPSQAIAPLDYVLQLAEAGMAEMRALIFELRPESLEHEGLVAALEKQAAATSARHSIAVDLQLASEPDIALDIKEMLYRVAQEAMHNTVKHAHATAIELRLTISNDRLLLDVSDNGRGFDATASFPGHLGLVSMRERAARAGGHASIASTPGAGTQIHVEVRASPPT